MYIVLKSCFFVDAFTDILPKLCTDFKRSSYLFKIVVVRKVMDYEF